MGKQDQAKIILKGGLGNQLFQFAFGVNFSIQKNTPITFSSEWFKTQNFRKPLMKDLLGIELDSPLDVFSKDKTIEFSLSKFSKFSNFKETVLQSEMHYNAEYILKKNCIFDGYWQSEKYFAENSEIIRNFLREKLRLETSKKSRLIMHVRRGDYLKKDVQDVHGILDVSYYTRAHDLLTKINTKKILITEDANEIEGEFSKFLNSNDFEVVTNQSEIHDLRMFSTATEIAIANSTFSWWGAYLSDARVVAPRKWFVEQELRIKNVCDIYPQGWILL